MIEFRADQRVPAAAAGDIAITFGNVLGLPGIAQFIGST
jgi:hypothetical protein